MIYTELTAKAMKLAYNAHHGQTDKNGIPYIFHPIHVAEQMNDEITVCIALLHDVIEDTDVTFEELQKEFPPEVTNAVKLLTHDDSEDYYEYVRKIRSDPYARAVKLADIQHNSDQSRITSDSNIDEKKKLLWKEKYAIAYNILMG